MKTEEVKVVPAHQRVTEMLEEALEEDRRETVKTLAELISRMEVPPEGFQLLYPVVKRAGEVYSEREDPELVGTIAEAIMCLQVQRRIQESEEKPEEERKSIYRTVNDLLNSLIQEIDLELVPDNKRRVKRMAEEKIQRILISCTGELPGITSAEKEQLIKTVKKAKKLSHRFLATGELAAQVIQNLQEE